MTNNLKVERLLKKYFPDATAQKMMRCIIDSPSDDISPCVKNKDLFSYKNKQYEQSLNVFEFLWMFRYEIKLSPEKLVSMIKSGAKPDDIARDVIMDSDFSYYPPFVTAAGGPNALNGREWADGSIMHNTVTFWDDQKIAYLQKQGVDWNQVSDLRKETGVLAATRAIFEGSPFLRVNRLIDLGANPRALDKFGRGLCDFVNTPRPSGKGWDKDGTQAAALKKRLREEFAMQC